jgi:hypothetical protein
MRLYHGNGQISVTWSRSNAPRIADARGGTKTRESITAERLGKILCDGYRLPIPSILLTTYDHIREHDPV